jgi:hypothetical protein
MVSVAARHEAADTGGHGLEVVPDRARVLQSPGREETVAANVQVINQEPEVADSAKQLCPFGGRVSGVAHLHIRPAMYSNAREFVPQYSFVSQLLRHV